MQITLKEKLLSPSKNVAYLTFKTAESFQFKEGQFAMLEIESTLGKLKRAYSIACANNGLNQISFYIKKVGNDGVSAYMTDTIDVGDSLQMYGPYGHMTNDFEKSNYLLVSVGSGLGPIIAIYDSLVNSGNFKKIVNIFGERYFQDTIQVINSKFSINNDKIKNLLFLSQDGTDAKGFYKGHVQDGINEALEFLDIADTKVFICGKPQMVNDVTEILVSKGISSQSIKSEKY